LAVMKGGTLLYISQALSNAPGSLSVVAPLYTPLAAHTSAAGKLLFGALSPQEQDLLLPRMDFTPATPHTITDPERFRQEANRAWQRGWGADEEEYALGIGCLAVPLFSQDTCVGALGITGGAGAYQDPARREEMLKSLRETAGQLSRSLFFYGS